MINWKKIKISILLLSVIFFTFFTAPSAKAGAWGEPIVAALLGETAREIYIEIYNVILGAAKQAAVESITSSVNSMISGGSGDGPLFITDWNDELFYKPARNTDVYMEGFFQSRYRGRGSGSNYIAANQGEGISGNYYTYLEQTARSSVARTDRQTVNVYDYCSDPFNPPAQEFWKCWNATAGKPLEEQLIAQNEQIAMDQQNQRKAEIQAIAYQGFKGSESNGQVVTPGSSIKDIQSNVTKLGFDTISGANSVPEVITSLVTKLVTKVVKEGIGNVQRNIQRKVNSSSSF